MTLLSAILCRAFGHKPYEYPRVVWRTVGPGRTDGEMVMMKRCKRCGAMLGDRPMLAGEDTIEA